MIKSTFETFYWILQFSYCIFQSYNLCFFIISIGWSNSLFCICIVFLMYISCFHISQILRRLFWILHLTVHRSPFPQELLLECYWFPLAVSYLSVVFFFFFMILDFLCWYLNIWVLDSSSRLYKFALTETDLHQSLQFGFLIMSTGNVLGQVGPKYLIFWDMRQLFKLWSWNSLGVQTWLWIYPSAYA